MAWNKFADEEVIVAVIDTGFDILHKDLKDTIWFNAYEIPQNGIDDDENGYIDDINGWDFYNNNKEVHNTNITDDEWHATQIGGIIAAEKKDEMISEKSLKIKIMPLKVYENGKANTSGIIEAIKYAEKMGAKIVNCSWGTYKDNTTLKETIKNSNMLFVCASGNEGHNTDNMPVYPASYDFNNVISVASINESGLLSDFSNYSTTNIDIAAPGENVLSCMPDQKYAYGTGTSFAAAHVSKEAALIFNKNKNISTGDLKSIITGSGDRLLAQQKREKSGSKNAIWSASNYVKKVFFIENSLIDGNNDDFSYNSFSLFAIPGQLQNISLVSTNNSITLSWAALSGITRYEIEVDGNIINAGTNLSYVHNGLTQNSVHRYRLRGINASGAGPWSNLYTKKTNTIITLKSTFDTYGYSTGAGNVGSQTTMQVMNAASYTSFFKFNLTSIPRNAIVKSAKVRLYMEAGGIAENRNYLNRCNDSYYDDFTEASNYSWFSHWPSCTTVDDVLVGNAAGWKEFSATAVKDTVGSWVNKTVLNRGFMLAPHSVTYDLGSGRYYRTREYGDTYAPQLVIEYEDPWLLQAKSTDNSITIVWNGISGASGYDIEVDGVTLANGTNTSYVHTGLNPNTQHTYRVRAKYGTELSEWSSIINTNTLFGKVLNISTEKTSYSIKLTWDTVVGVNSYEIDADGTIMNNGANTSFVHSGLERNTQHSYKIRGIGSNGPGEWSDPVNVTTNNNRFVVLKSVFDTYGRFGDTSGHGSETTFQVCNGGTFMGVIKFNLSSVPVTANIINSSFRVFMNDQPGGTTTHMNLLSRLNDSYYDSFLENSEYDWNDHSPLTTSLQEITVGKNEGWKEWSSAALSNNIKSWINGSVLNRGFILGTTATAYDTAIRNYRTKEYGDTYAPQLIIEYSDIVSPNVNANLASRDWANTDITVNLSYTDDFDSVVPIKQYAWSTSTAVPTSWANYTGTVSRNTNGAWYLHYKATDSSGNSKIGYYGPYKIDKTMPTISPNISTRDWNNSNVTVTLTYSDTGGSGLKTKQYAWSKSTSTPVSWSNYSSAVSQTMDGEWYLHYKVIDNAGNTKIGYYGTYKIDKTLPTVTESKIISNDTVTVNLSYSDAGGSGMNIKQYAWSTSNTTPVSWTNYTNAISHTLDQPYYLHYKGTDYAGNIRIGYFGPYAIGNSNYTYSINGVLNKEYKIVFKAQDIININDREFEVQYNANDLDVIDLCAFTKEPELGIGIPDGTTISIVEYSPGIIRFTMNPSIPVDKKWSGISNVIIFRSKINGQTSVNYCCE